MTIRSVLLESCVLDIANLTLDRDERTPSLKKLVEALADPELLAALREAYAVWHLAPAGGLDPETIKVLQAAERKEEETRRAQFDRHVAELGARWVELEDSPALDGFSTMRDRLIAHTELRYQNGEYRPFDVSQLGLKYTDLDGVVSSLDALVNLVNLVFRAADFAFDDHDRQLQRMSDGFWGDRPHS